MHLTANGCQFLREGRRHSIWMNPVNNRQTALPGHTEINEITARKICQALWVYRSHDDLTASREVPYRLSHQLRLVHVHVVLAVRNS